MSKSVKRKKKLGSITKFWGETGPGWPLMKKFMKRDKIGNLVYTADRFLNDNRVALHTLLSDELKKDKVWVKLKSNLVDDELAANNLRDARRKITQPLTKVPKYNQI